MDKFAFFSVVQPRFSFVHQLRRGQALELELCKLCHVLELGRTFFWGYCLDLARFAFHLFNLYVCTTVIDHSFAKLQHITKLNFV